MAELPAAAQDALGRDDVEAMSALLCGLEPAGLLEVLRAAALLGAARCAERCCAHAAATLPQAEPLALEQDRHSWTALHHAAQAGHADVLAALLQSIQGHPCGVDIATEDVRISRLSHLCGGVTPLHLASAAGEVAAVRLLLAARAQPDVRDFNGWGAADHAGGRPAVLELLHRTPSTPMSKQEYEAATRSRNEARAAGLTATEFAGLVECADEGVARPLRQLLLATDAKSLRIGTAPILQAATSLGSPLSLRAILRALAEQGKPGHDPEAAQRLPIPGLNDLDGMGFAPLHTAVETGFSECIAPLLEARADANVRTADASYQLGQTSTLYMEGGRTPLHIAAEKAAPDAVAALLAGGADAGVRSWAGQTARELAEEGLVASAGAASANLTQQRAAEVLRHLGASAAEVAALSERDPRSAQAARQARQQAVRQRVAAAASEGEAKARAADAAVVRERYKPLDAAVASGALLLNGAAGTDIVCFLAAEGPQQPPAAAPLCRVLAPTGSDQTGVEQPLPGVFVFRLLSEALCARIYAETEHYLAAAAKGELPLPVRHDGGLDVSRVFPELMSAVAEAARPAIQAFLPPGLHGVTLRHAFRTKNYVGRDETFRRHVDKYAVTLNVCIRKTPDVVGSGVFFFDSDTSDSPVYRHEHAVGLAVLHSSKEWHQTEPLTAGERSSLIMWFDARPAEA